MPRSTSSEPDLHGPADTSLESCDEGAQDLTRRGDCPAELLAGFSELMAAQGWPVEIERMRADRAYAIWQLARARTTGDDRLKALAAALFARLRHF